MLTDITIGQYFPGNSLLHRLDPRIKILLTVAFIVMIFIPSNWFGLGAAVLYLGVAIACSGLPLRLIWKSVKPILIIVLFTAILNVFYVNRGEILWEWSFIRITSGGLVSAAFLAVRIVSLIAGSSLLTYTTGPTTLTDALERLMKPLKVVKVPVHELAMMMTIALRFIPTLIEETDKIMSAQKARGADIDSGGLLKRIKALVPILIPLFVSSFSRAYELAMAMECRCYRGGDGRTRMKVLHMAARDWAALTATLGMIAGLIALNMFVQPVI